jgi:hypothetical protein
MRSGGEDRRIVRDIPGHSRQQPTLDSTTRVTLVWTGRCDEARAILEELTERPSLDDKTFLPARMAQNMTSLLSNRVVSENSNALWRHYLPNAFLPGISSLSS